MPYQEEELTKQRRHSSKHAINLAMEGRWQEAVTVNQSIIENFPNDIEAHNRLGRAYIELGRYRLARQAYNRTIELDSYNAIAEKNLNRLDVLGEEAAATEEASPPVEPRVFIEEIGKAGVVNLDHLAQKETLAKIDAGDKLSLKIDGSSLLVESSTGSYLGRVETNHSRRLLKLINGGNQYSVIVISASENRLVVIIRETYQHPSQLGRLSFPARGSLSLRPYTDEQVSGQETEYKEAIAEGDAFNIDEEEGTEALPGESISNTGHQDEDEEK